jgi:RNA polymerase sigma-70 factor (ECF subfamily)
MHDREDAARRAMKIAMGIAMATLGNRDDAADVAQDVALDVLRSLGRLRDPAAFDAWVRKIAVRHAVRARRRRPAVAAHVAEDSVIDRDLLIASRAALSRALAELPPRQAIALALRYVHDLTDREIAQALGCRRGTANALLSRGRAALREVAELQELMEATR